MARRKIIGTREVKRQSVGEARDDLIATEEDEDGGIDGRRGVERLNSRGCLVL